MDGTLIQYILHRETETLERDRQTDRQAELQDFEYLLLRANNAEQSALCTYNFCMKLRFRFCN